MSLPGSLLLKCHEVVTPEVVTPEVVNPEVVNL